MVKWSIPVFLLLLVGGLVVHMVVVHGAWVCVCGEAEQKIMLNSDYNIL